METSPHADALLERAALQLHLALPVGITDAKTSITHGSRIIDVIVRPVGSALPMRQDSPPLSPCERVALEVLRKHGGHLTWRAVLAALHLAGRRYSETHVRRALSRLVFDELLRNEHDGRGYIAA